jgi:hypothetical protein
LATAAMRGWRPKRNNSGLQALAARRGLNYGDTDPYGSSRLLFDRFNEGIERGFGPYVFPADHQRELRAFEFWWEVQTDRNERVRYWSTCVAGTFPVWAPYLVISPERWATKLLSMVTAADVEVESEEFNRMFHVRCDSKRFATLVLTPALIELMVVTDGLIELEIHGDSFCVTTRRARPDQYPSLLRLADDIASRVPANLVDLFAPGPAR